MHLNIHANESYAWVHTQTHIQIYFPSENLCTHIYKYISTWPSQSTILYAICKIKNKSYYFSIYWKPNLLNRTECFTWNIILNMCFCSAETSLVVIKELYEHWDCLYYEKWSFLFKWLDRPLLYIVITLKAQELQQSEQFKALSYNHHYLK